MGLRPEDIHDKEFSVKMRGYNIDQVNDFLDQVVKDYKNTIDENSRLKSALRIAQNKVNHFDAIKDSLNQSILVAQAAADRVKANAKKKSAMANAAAEKNATIISKHAETQARAIITQAIQKAHQLNDEIMHLTKSTQVFRNKAQALIKSQLEFTENKRWDDLLKGVPNAKVTNLAAKLSNENNVQTSDTKAVVYYPDGTSKQF